MKINWQNFLLKLIMSQRKIKKLKALQTLQSNHVNESEYKYFGILNLLRENWKFLVGLCVGVFGLYFNSLAGAFVSDDYATIPQNPLINDFVLAAKGSVVGLSNYFIYQIFGFSSPIPYHLYSLLIYLIVIVSSFLFVFILFENKLLAQLSSLLFAVMPIHVEAVSWISGKPYSLMALSFLISMIIMVKYLKTGNKFYLWPLALSIIFNIYVDKIRFFSFLFVSIIYVFTFNWKGKDKVDWYKIFLGVSIFLVAIVIIAYPAIMIRINAVNSGVNASGSLFYNPFFQYPTSIAKYLQLMWFPIDLTLYHTMYIFPNWLNWSILLTYVSMLIYFFFTNKKYFFGLIFIFATAAPSMAPIKVSWLVAERYVFLGSLGFAIFLGMIVVDLSKYFRLLPSTVFVSLVILSIVRTWTRNIDWQSNHNLWVNTCQVSPNSHNAWNNIGDDYDKLKDYPNAIKGFTQSTIVKPNYADAFHNRANIFFKIGRLDLARESYLLAVQINPGLFQTYLSLTQVDLMDKRGEQAIADATMATKVAPDNPQSWYVLGVVLAQLGNISESKLTMEKVLQMNPDFKPAADALMQLRSQS